MGGMAGSVPLATTMPLRAAKTRSPSAVLTVTCPGPVILPKPRTSCPPFPVNRSAAFLSSQ